MMMVGGLELRPFLGGFVAFIKIELVLFGGGVDVVGLCV